MRPRMGNLESFVSQRGPVSWSSREAETEPRSKSSSTRCVVLELRPGCGEIEAAELTDDGEVNGHAFVLFAPGKDVRPGEGRLPSGFRAQPPSAGCRWQPGRAATAAGGYASRGCCTGGGVGVTRGGEGVANFAPACHEPLLGKSDGRFKEAVGAQTNVLMQGKKAMGEGHAQPIIATNNNSGRKDPAEKGLQNQLQGRFGA